MPTLPAGCLFPFPGYGENSSKTALSSEKLTSPIHETIGGCDIILNLELPYSSPIKYPVFYIRAFASEGTDCSGPIKEFVSKHNGREFKVRIKFIEKE